MEENLNINKKPKRKVSISTYVVVTILIIFAGAYSYYMSLPDEFAKNKDIAISLCVDLCIKEQSKGTIFADGPCLSEEITTGWVCDVVHIPRVSLIDNKEQNQCQSYVNKVAKHFVEVNTECSVVRAK